MYNFKHHFLVSNNLTRFIGHIHMVLSRKIELAITCVSEHFSSVRRMALHGLFRAIVFLPMSVQEEVSRVPG